MPTRPKREMNEVLMLAVLVLPWFELQGSGCDMGIWKAMDVLSGGWCYRAFIGPNSAKTSFGPFWGVCKWAII